MVSPSLLMPSFASGVMEAFAPLVEEGSGAMAEIATQEFLADAASLTAADARGHSYSRR